MLNPVPRDRPGVRRKEGEMKPWHPCYYYYRNLLHCGFCVEAEMYEQARSAREAEGAPQTSGGQRTASRETPQGRSSSQKVLDTDLEL